MIRALVLALLLTFPAAGLPIFGEGPFPFGPDYKDQDLVRVQIDPSIYGTTVPMDFTFDVDFANFTYDPGDATALPGGYGDGQRDPQRGHFHVYGTLLDDGFNDTNIFLGAPAATLIDADTVRFGLTFPEPGEYLLVVQPQYDDHSPRLNPHPQAWPAIDFTRVTASPVIPEPSSLALLLLGALLLMQRPRR